MTMEGLKSNRPIKILLIGDSSVGKTSLMFRFTDNIFSETFTPTIGIDFKIKTIPIKGKLVKLQIWDTAGQEKFFNITRSFYRNADVIFLVYDRTEASSFQNVARWMRNIDENTSEDVPRVLVGNKSDLHHLLVISTQDGKHLADKFHVDFFETSAKSDTSQDVSKMFNIIIEKMLNQRKPISDHSTIKLDESDNPSDSIYGKLIGCCSSATTTTLTIKK